MDRDIGYVYIILHKKTNLYKVGKTINEERRFKELDVGGATKLVKSYRVFNHSSVEKLCHRAFANKRLPQSEYFQLTDEDLNEIKKILEENKFKTKKTLREERDARRVLKLKKYREKYFQSSEVKRFIMRHDKKFNSAFGCGFSLLLLSPLVAFAVMILKAYGISRYLLLFPIFGLFFLGLWGSNKEDKRNQEELLGEEDEVIRKDIEIWKSIDATTDAYEDRNYK